MKDTQHAIAPQMAAFLKMMAEPVAMYVLMLHLGRPAEAVELGQMLGVHKQTAARHLHILEGLHMVRRCPLDPHAGSRRKGYLVVEGPWPLLGEMGRAVQNMIAALDGLASTNPPGNPAGTQPHPETIPAGANPRAQITQDTPTPHDPERRGTGQCRTPSLARTNPRALPAKESKNTKVSENSPPAHPPRKGYLRNPWDAQIVRYLPGGDGAHTVDSAQNPPAQTAQNPRNPPQHNAQNIQNPSRTVNFARNPLNVNHRVNINTSSTDTLIKYLSGSVEEVVLTRANARISRNGGRGPPGLLPKRARWIASRKGAKGAEVQIYNPVV